MNAANRARNNPLGTRAPLLRRVDHGLYVRASQRREPAERAAVRASAEEPTTPDGGAADVILIGCVQTKRAVACAAEELFASPLFVGRRRYAAGRGVPWYTVSAKFGLLAPGDVIGPYDVYLADQSLAYRTAWGGFVAAQLEQKHPDLRDWIIEVHAGAAYADPLRAPLAARGAALRTPLARSAAGEAAWCAARRFTVFPVQQGGTWWDVSGSDVLPGAERLREQQHDSQPVVVSRRMERCAGGPARHGES